MNNDRDETPWCAEHQDILRREWEAGTKSSEIAGMLKRTKNSVIGKARRMNLKPRATGVPKSQRAPKNKPKPAKPVLVKPEPEKVVAPAPIAAEPVKPVPFWKRWLVRAKEALFPMQLQLDLAPEPEGVLWITATRRQCQAIPGDPKSGSIDELRCCGKPVVDGKPYCIEHMMAFYVPEPARKNIKPAWRQAA